MRRGLLLLIPLVVVAMVVGAVLYLRPWSPVAGYYIEGYRPFVSFRYGNETTRLSLDDARLIADWFDHAKPQCAALGCYVIAQLPGGGRVAISSSEAPKIPGYLRSAIRYAEGWPNEAQREPVRERNGSD